MHILKKFAPRLGKKGEPPGLLQFPREIMIILKRHSVFFHFLSFSFIFVHFSFIFRSFFVHFSFIFVHFSFRSCLSLSYIVLHCLSFSFIVFHCLFLFSFFSPCSSFFLAAQFFCASIASRFPIKALMYAKNIFLAHLGEGVPWAPLFLFFLLFVVPPFFVFFSFSCLHRWLSSPSRWLPVGYQLATVWSSRLSFQNQSPRSPLPGGSPFFLGNTAHSEEVCSSPMKKVEAEKPVKPPGRRKHRHTARRNNVQISSANLRVDIPVNLHVENMKFFQKLAD